MSQTRKRYATVGVNMDGM